MTTEDRSSFMTVYVSICGWQSKMMWWNPDHDGFWEPYQTGFGPYGNSEKGKQTAIREAKHWAECEGLKYVEPRGEPLK